MAHKLEIRKHLGQFHVKLGPTADLGKETTLATLDEVLALVQKKAGKLDLDVENVIYNGIAFDSVAALVSEARASRF